MRGTLKIGGNLCQVKWYNKVTNLHHVWDTKLIESQKLSYTEYASWIEELYGESKLNLTEDIRSWVHESRSLLPGIYRKVKKV